MNEQSESLISVYQVSELLSSLLMECRHCIGYVGLHSCFNLYQIDLTAQWSLSRCQKFVDHSQRFIWAVSDCLALRLALLRSITESSTLLSVQSPPWTSLSLTTALVRLVHEQCAKVSPSSPSLLQSSYYRILVGM